MATPHKHEKQNHKDAFEQITARRTESLTVTSPSRDHPTGTLTDVDHDSTGLHVCA